MKAINLLLKYYHLRKEFLERMDLEYQKLELKKKILDLNIRKLEFLQNQMKLESSQDQIIEVYFVGKDH